jgi:2-methylcitrate dehydratase PrpD
MIGVDLMKRASCLSALMDVLNQMNYESMPPEVREKAKICVADFVGVFYSGSIKRESKRLFEALGGEKILKEPEKLALWMASAARFLDLDDGHRFAMGHPGVVINAAAIATAANTPGVKWEKVLEAIVKGYEVYSYQGRVINPSAYLQRGFDATGICGAAGAAVVASTIMNLDECQISDAISLAASLCGGLNQYAIEGSSPKYLCAGWACNLGITAANLARYGMGGPMGIFEGRLGYCNGFSPSPNLELLNKPTLRWEIQYVYLKKYSCVRRIHATLDAVEQIFNREGLSTDQIKQIDVFGGQFLCDAVTYQPDDLVKAQTSVPYTVALLMTYGDVSCELVERNLENPKIADLSKLVRVTKDEEFVRLAEREPNLWGAARVEITTKNGERYVEQRNIAIGDPENPFPKEVIHRKFVGLVTEALGEKKAESIWNNINNLEQCGELERLLATMCDRHK